MSAESFFEEGDADALRTTDLLEHAGGPRRAFIISAKRAKRTQTTLPSSASPATDCWRKSFSSRRQCRGAARQAANHAKAKGHRTPCTVVDIEQVSRR